MYGSKQNQSQFKSYPDCNTDGTQAFCSTYELQRLTNLNIFITITLKNLTVPHMNMVRMAQVVERKTGNPMVQGSHLIPQHFEVVCFWAWFTFNIKLFI